MTRHDPREPLDADERELAGRLSRLGADGPSPALDANILAAARAAVAPRPARKRHWLAWASVPPAAITGVGVAAACVLALGVVWQMRPRVSMVPAAAESEEEVFIVAAPAPGRAPVANPPPIEEAAAAADAAATAVPSQKRRERDAASMADESAPAPAVAGVAPREARADAAAGAPAPAPQAFGNAAPEMAAADAAAAAANEVRQREETAAQAEAEDTAAAKVRRPTYTSTARATAEHSRRNQAFAPPPPPAAAPARQETTTFPADPEQQPGTELDRVEVTGGRNSSFDPKALAGLAPTEDRKLDREDWLLRIRARRDAGDIAGARESLRLFRKEYPRVHLPEDLRKLVTDTTP